MDTKKEVARIMRDVAAVTDQDQAMLDHAHEGRGMAVPNHFNKSGVTGGSAATKNAQRDRDKVTIPTPRKP